jgi:flavin-dependent dehydrogenase
MYTPGLRPWGRVGSLPVFLVGDAGGQVKVTTVGGTLTGFWGAQAAARAILTGGPYARLFWPLKWELDLHWFIRELLEQLNNPGYDRLVQQINPGVIKFLSRRSRDEMAGAFWRLLYLQPRYITMGLSLLFKRFFIPGQLKEFDPYLAADR